MAGSRRPGPLGLNPAIEDLNDGTMVRGLSPPPGPIGAPAPSMTGLPGGLSVTLSGRPRKSFEVDFQSLRRGRRGPASFKPAGIWEWPLQEKFAEVLRRTPPRLPASMRKEFEALLSPTSLSIIAGTLVVWAGAHAFGVGEVIDVGMLIGGAFFIGMAVFDFASEVGDFLVVTSTATNEKDLDEAASHLARAIAIVGVAAFVALVAKVAKGRGAGSSGEIAESTKAAEPAGSPPTGARRAPSAPARPEARPAASDAVPKRDSYVLDREGVPVGAREGIAKPGLPAETLSKEGWPDLPGSHARNFNSAEPGTLKPGTKIYRIIDDSSNPAGGYWTEKLPADRAEWRSSYAVKNDWNVNGSYVEYTVPEGPGLNVWRGETAAQQLQGSNFYLPGGGQQIWLPPNTVTPGPAKPTGW